MVFDRPLPADAGVVPLRQHDFVHGGLPCAFDDLGIARRKIGAGDLQVHGGLLVRLVLGMEQTNPGCPIFGAKGFLLASQTVVRPKIIATAEHSESLFHTLYLSVVSVSSKTSFALGSSECPVVRLRADYDPPVKPADISADIPHFSTHKCLVKQHFRVGGEVRNRPDFPAVAPQICLISLGIQAKTVLSDPIVFNPFGVRFGVRLPISIL
jgi:hypothetical protein